MQPWPGIGLHFLVWEERKPAFRLLSKIGHTCEFREKPKPDAKALTTAQSFAVQSSTLPRFLVERFRVGVSQRVGTQAAAL